MNRSLWGAIPELGRRGVELHLSCAAHAEHDGPHAAWCWGSMGIWVVGPILDPGHCMMIADHGLVALYHPRQVGKMSTDLSKYFSCSSYKYSVLDPSDLVRLDMDEEYSLVEADSKVFLRWATTIHYDVTSR